MIASPQRVAEVIGDIKIIDTDTHLSEPHDLWVKRAPQKMKDRVPRVVEKDGVTSWIIDADTNIGKGAAPSCCVLKNGEKPRGLGHHKYTIDMVHPGSFDIKERVKVMDELGIWAQVLYSNILGFGGQNTARVEHDLRLVTVQIYNDAMAEFQEESGQRIFPMALLPWWDVKHAVAETRRAHAMGLRGININSDPHHHKDADGEPLPDLGSRYWDPLWEVCQDLDVPINFHIGASEQVIDFVGQQGWPSLSYESMATIGGTMLFVNNGRVMANIIMSGLLDRFPRLKFVSVESGIGWIPFILEGLDYQFLELDTTGSIQRVPSEYFARNFYACFWFEQRGLAEVVRRVGVDNVLFETDFPHPTCLHPSPIERSAEALSTLDLISRRKVLSGNASGLYRISIN